MKNKRGYSVVEILLVTAILLIVTAISLVLVFGQIQKARNIAALSTLSSINSMYRMSGAIAMADMPQHIKPANLPKIELPSGVHKTALESFLTDSMHSSFTALDDIKYTLIDENGLETGGGVIITYWPKKDEYEHFIWRDGEVTRYYMKDLEEKIS